QLDLSEYEDNELVQEVVQDLWKFFQSKNCECRMRNTYQCFEKVGFKRFFERHMQFRSLDKKELDLVLMGQLMAFEYNQTNENAKQKFNYQFNNDIKLCKNTYLKLIGVGNKHLIQINESLKNKGLVERLHGNTKRIPNTKSRTKIDQTVSTLVSTFISNYANVHRYPSPGRHLQHDTQSIIYLPTDQDYTKVYNNFIECLNIFPEKPFDKISYKSFVRIWKELLPYIKFMTLGTDLCETYEMLKAEIRCANYNEERELIQKKLDDHKQKAEIEREYYRNNILTSTILPDTVHVCYDWAQNVPVPYSPQQIGATYFKSAFQAHIFGICNTGQNPAQQLNYIIAENEFPQGTGKGANTTISLVYNGLQRFHNHEKHLKVTCDNCSAQNKNNLSLYFWCWLTLVGMYDTIEVNFIVTGHTKFICDGYFGNIKTLFRKTIINTVDDVQKVINKSTKNNTNNGIRYNDGEEWAYYDFSKFLKPHFKELPGILKYNYFLFTSKDPGKVLCQTKAYGTYSTFNILKSRFDINEVLDKISLKPYQKNAKNIFTIRKYVDIKFQEITCPKPS
ncbi:28597_t:CDS:1, partial [Gigaspora margarita]